MGGDGWSSARISCLSWTVDRLFLLKRAGDAHWKGFKLALKVIAIVTHARHPPNASDTCGHDKGSADATRCGQGALGPFVLPILLVWQS